MTGFKIKNHRLLEIHTVFDTSLWANLMPDFLVKLSKEFIYCIRIHFVLYTLHKPICDLNKIIYTLNLSMSILTILFILAHTEMTCLNVNE